MTALSRNAVGLLLALAALAASSSGALAQSQTTRAPQATARPAATTKTARSTFEKRPVPVVDVALSEEGVVRGRVLTENGKPVDGAQVVIRQGDELLHKLLTNKKGEFSAKGLRAGVYTIATVQGSGMYRLWPKNIAPPSAKTQALVMAQRPVMRAQYGTGALADWTSIGLGVAGLTVGIISLDKINNLEDDVNALKSP